MKNIRKRLAVFAAVFATLFVIGAPSVTYAQEAPAIEVNDTLASLELSAVTVTMLISLVIPVLVGLVTKANLSGQWKGLISLVLNLVSAAIVTATVADGTAVWSKETLISALVAGAISVTTYLGVYKPVDLNSKLAPDKGL